MTTPTRPDCPDCDCADPTALFGLADECDCTCHTPANAPADRCPVTYSGRACIFPAGHAAGHLDALGYDWPRSGFTPQWHDTRPEPDPEWRAAYETEARRFAVLDGSRPGFDFDGASRYHVQPCESDCCNPPRPSRYPARLYDDPATDC